LNPYPSGRRAVAVAVGRFFVGRLMAAGTLPHFSAGANGTGPRVENRALVEYNYQ
jgi:hypothetical protein